LTFNGTNLAVGASSTPVQFAVQKSSTSFGLEFDTSGGFASGPTIRGYYRTGSTYNVLALTGSAVAFGINDVEKMRLSSGGALMVGTTTGTDKFTLANSAGLGAAMVFWGNGVGSANELYIGQGASNEAYVFNRANNYLLFGTNNTEAARIDSSQHLLVGNTTPVIAVNYYKAYIQGGTSANSNSTALADQKCGLYLYDSEGGNTNNENAQNALVIATSQGASVSPANLITGYVTYPTPVRTFQVTAYGNVYNYSGVYGTLSDQKVKQDIVDASSQWQDIKNVRIRKYRLKSEVERNENAPSFIGVVAQELE